MEYLIPILIIGFAASRLSMINELNKLKQKWQVDGDVNEAKQNMIELMVEKSYEVNESEDRVHFRKRGGRSVSIVFQKEGLSAVFSITASKKAYNDVRGLPKKLRAVKAPGAAQKSHWWETVRTILPYGLIAVFGVWWLFAVGGSDDSNVERVRRDLPGSHQSLSFADLKRAQQKAVEQPKPSKKTNVQIPQYTIADEKVDEMPLKTQVEMRVLVSGDLTEAGLRSLLSKLHNEIRGRTGFTHHQHPTHIFIYAHTEEGQVGTAGWVAMLSRVGEDASPKIKVNTEMLAALKEPKEATFGLTEEQRRAYWKESIAAERRAQREADQKFPITPTVSRDTLDKNADYAFSYGERYKTQVRQKYNLTDEQMYEVVSEAMTKNWPME